jgi:hypothetical protein
MITTHTTSQNWKKNTGANYLWIPKTTTFGRIGREHPWTSLTLSHCWYAKFKSSEGAKVMQMAWTLHSVEIWRCLLQDSLPCGGNFQPDATQTLTKEKHIYPLMKLKAEATGTFFQGPEIHCLDKYSVPAPLESDWCTKHFHSYKDDALYCKKCHQFPVLWENDGTFALPYQSAASWIQAWRNLLFTKL